MPINEIVVIEGELEILEEVDGEVCMDVANDGEADRVYVDVEKIHVFDKETEQVITN